MFSTRVLLSAALISTALAGPWANLCAGKPSNEIRKCDSHGCGQYSAQSNQRPHQGVDVLCTDGSTVYAPFTGMIMGQEKPYKNKNVINNGVRLSGRDNQPSEVVKRQNIAGCGCCSENQAHLEIDSSSKVKQEQYLLPSRHICSVEMETLDPRTFFLERIGT